MGYTKIRFYQIDNILFYKYDISLGDMVLARIINGELWFEDIVKRSSNSTIRLFCADDLLWKDIKLKLNDLNCRCESTNKLKAINIPNNSIQTILSYFENIKESNADFDYEDSSLRL